jgi:small subunit ribosomal protein S2
MKPYIYKKRNLIHIIDLRQTIRGLVTAEKVARAIAEKGEYILFAGTKRQAQPIVEREAQRCGMPYVTDRWPGGLLTNYVTIRKRLERLDELEELERTGRIQEYSKKMISSLRREKRKILRNLGGVREMDRLPGLLIVVDPADEDIAIREAVKLEIPTVAWMDTDGDPEDIDVVVPANDDAIGSIEIFARIMADAVLEGRERAEIGPGEAARQTDKAERQAAPPEEPPQPEETAQPEKTSETETPEETPPAEEAQETPEQPEESEESAASGEAAGQ